MQIDINSNGDNFDMKRYDKISIIRSDCKISVKTAESELSDFSVDSEDPSRSELFHSISPYHQPQEFNTVTKNNSIFSNEV